MNYRNVRQLLSLGALLSAVAAVAPVAVAEEEVMGSCGYRRPEQSAR